MKLKLENSRKRTAIYKEYFCVITTYKQYQVIRFYGGLPTEKRVSGKLLYN